MSAIPKPIRAAVLSRANEHCEGCRKGTTHLELHHRQFRSRGGKHTVVNLVALCGWGNHTGCHGLAHSSTPPDGWAVHSWDDPATVPFVDLFGFVVALKEREEG